MNEISNILPASIPLPKSSIAQNGRDNANQVTAASNPLNVVSTNPSALTASDNQQLHPDTIKAVVETANTKLHASNNNLKFKVDDATNQVVVSVIDTATGEVIRQIPDVDILKFMQAMALQESNKGNLYAKTA